MTSATTPKTIDLGGKCIRREGVAGGAITPGMLIERTTGDLVAVHDDADNLASAMFALEYDLCGKGIGDAYAQGDQVLFGDFQNGSAVNALLASGQNITKGALLTSNGDGYLKAAGSTSFVIGIARESVNATAAAKRIKVEVLLGKAAAGAE